MHDMKGKAKTSAELLDGLQLVVVMNLVIRSNYVPGTWRVVPVRSIQGNRLLEPVGQGFCAARQGDGETIVGFALAQYAITDVLKTMQNHLVI